MGLGVALGAYSSHAAGGAVHPEAARLLQAAVLFQLVHGIGVILAGVIYRGSPSRWVIAAGALHVGGVAAFCGTLWYLAFTAHSAGMLAPIGGLLLIGGWLALAGAAIFGADRRTP